MTKKIGCMLTFLDFRNDVRKLIYEIAAHTPVVLFVRKEHVSLIQPYLRQNLTYRLIDERKPTIANKLNERRYLLMKQLPASRSNYYLMEAFKVQTIKDPAIASKADKIIRLQKKLPHFVSYDKYLDSLSYSSNTDLTNIDYFICLTEIYDDYLFARLIREKRKTFVYVYSWDHPCKHTRFSQRVTYLVWNNSIAEDLTQLQKIPSKQISVIGSTQLCYIHELNFCENAIQSPKQNIIYFGCGIGIASLVDSEVDVIIALAKVMKKIKPEFLLLVRPYPNQRDWNKYDRLKSFDNIKIEADYRQTDLSISEENIQSKFKTINSARAFIHTGTTLGVEAAFTNCPAFIADLSKDSGEDVSIYHFTHQYQNEKYLIHASDYNTIRSIEEFENILNHLEEPQYMELSYRIREQFSLQSFHSIAEYFLQLN